MKGNSLGNVKIRFVFSQGNECFGWQSQEWSFANTVLLIQYYKNVWTKCHHNVSFTAKSQQMSRLTSFPGPTLLLFCSHNNMWNGRAVKFVSLPLQCIIVNKLMKREWGRGYAQIMGVEECGVRQQFILQISAIVDWHSAPPLLYC